jgi:hypothetical protein
MHKPHTITLYKIQSYKSKAPKTEARNFLSKYLLRSIAATLEVKYKSIKCMQHNKKELLNNLE